MSLSLRDAMNMRLNTFVIQQRRRQATHKQLPNHKRLHAYSEENREKKKRIPFVFRNGECETHPCLFDGDRDRVRNTLDVDKSTLNFS